MPENTSTHPFSELLTHSVSEPGKIHEAYTAFHGYSLGNRLLAMVQCAERGITPGPLATFPQWKDRGRHVMKGQKALTLCQPVTVKAHQDNDEPDAEPTTFTRVIYRPRWFVLAQTDGEPFTAPVTAAWDKDQALAALDVTEIPFDALDGNCQGFARGRSIAVSPVAALPLKTTFHELAHVLLGHTAEAELTDDERTPRSLREVEAEAVAMLCCASLNLPGIGYSRGYIQHWNASGQPIPERSACRIFKAADQILRAGQPTTEEGPGE